MKSGQTAFWQALARLDVNLQRLLKTVPEHLVSKVQEIRLIEGCSPQIIINGSALTLNGQVTEKMLSDSLITLCEHAVHSYQRELANGYITLEGGHRAGFAATAVYGTEKTLIGMREITSIVLRIAREYQGVSQGLLKKAFENGVCGLLIAGAPSSGKTTMLRDIATQLAAKAIKVAVIDERLELCGYCHGCCVMKGYNKAEGMLIALRNLSPQVIICDEIGSAAEANAIEHLLNCGVAVITTVHAKDKQELLKRSAIKKLIDSGAFKKIAVLCDNPTPCTLREVFDCDDFLAQGNGVYHGDVQLLGVRNF